MKTCLSQGSRRFESPLDPHAGWPSRYVSVRRCGGLTIILLQLKYPLGTIREEYGISILLGYGLSCWKRHKTHSFIPFPRGLESGLSLTSLADKYASHIVHIIEKSVLQHAQNVTFGLFATDWFRLTNWFHTTCFKVEVIMNESGHLGTQNVVLCNCW